MAAGGGSAAPSAAGPNAALQGVWRTLEVVVPVVPGTASRTFRPEGATSASTYRREGDLLTLTQVRTHAGPSPNPITVKLTRVE
jgi:hypothetical protein